MKVLVILASFNGGKYIKEQIDSILSQIDVDVQLAVYDDLSVDNTLSIIENYNNPKIKIFRNSICSGSAAINFCNAILSINEIDLSEINYIALSDQDDIWSQDKISIAINRLSENNASLYASNLIMFNGDSSAKHILGVIKKDFKQKKYDFLFEGGSAGCTYVFDKSLFLKLKEILQTSNFLYWKYFSHDWFIYFVARISGHKVFFDSNSYIYYRIHESNAHGHLNIFSFNSFFKRLSLLQSGWYFNQVIGFEKLLNIDSTEYNIYQLFKKNTLTRFYVLLRFNFNLIRNPVKFLQFFILNLFK
jgi:rhamnosyltransferase